MTATEQNVTLAEPLLVPAVEELPIVHAGQARFGSSGVCGAAVVDAAQSMES